MPEILPELGALAAAGTLLIIAAALWVLQGLIRNSLGRLPLVGGWINANIDAALNDARNAVLSGASSAWGAAIQLFRWLQEFSRNPIAGTINAFAQVYSLGRRIVGVYLPDLESRVLIDASGWFSSAETYALSLYRAAISSVNGAVSSALTTASGWFATAETDARNLFDTATADIANAVVAVETDAANAVARSSTVLTADIAAAEAFAAGSVSALAASVQSAVSQLSGDIVTGVATAEATAAASLAAVAGGIYTDLDTWGRAAVADAWPDVTGDIGALRRTLGADFPWLNDLTGALAGAGAAGLLGALIRSVAGAHAITRLADECIVPNCRNLSPYGRDLSDLLGAASTAALLTWLTEAVVSPAAWARDTESVLGPVASGATQAARTLLGGR